MTDIILPIGTAIVGGILGFLFDYYCKRETKKNEVYDKMILNNELDNLKDKLDIYWKIYFKLLICLSAKLQIKKIKDLDASFNNMITMENDVIIKNLEEIIDLITKNIQKLDIDDNLLDMILRFITHVLTYKCLKQMNIKKKPSEYGFSFPDDFTYEITKRTLLYQENYDKYVGNNYDINKLKEINNYTKQHLCNLDSSPNRINFEFQKKIKDIYEKNMVQFNSILNNNQSDDDNISIELDTNINPDDINLHDIFINVYQTHNKQ